MTVGPVQLGLGLLALGRPWGTRSAPPTREEAYRVIRSAIDLDIRFFDTAPAYGCSEELLGNYANTPHAFPADALICTKMGEVWDLNCGTRVDHSLNALKASVDQSLNLLPRIDVLQLHKANPSNIGSPDVRHAFDYARSRGITSFGASVSDLETARAAIVSGLYSYLQFPLNSNDLKFQYLPKLCYANGITPIINRPFAMGALLTTAERNSPDAAENAFLLLTGLMKGGVILTGTADRSHLTDNTHAFLRALARHAA